MWTQAVFPSSRRRGGRAVQKKPPKASLEPRRWGGRSLTIFRIRIAETWLRKRPPRPLHQVASRLEAARLRFASSMSRPGATISPVSGKFTHDCAALHRRSGRDLLSADILEMHTSVCVTELAGYYEDTTCGSKQ